MSVTEQPLMADEEADGDEGIEVECEHCGYTWVYKGEMWTATCPRCNAKTESGLRPEDDEE